MRFSTVTLGREFPDEARNPRGFAIKLYTTEGNYDIVGLNFVSAKVSRLIRYTGFPSVPTPPLPSIRPFRILPLLASPS